MSIHVSEPGRPVGTRLPEIYRGRRVGDVTELQEAHNIDVSHSDATDAEFQQAAHSGRQKALEEYGAAAAGERKEARPYLPVSKISTPVTFSIDAASSVADALNVMDDNGINHLIVLADGNVAGLLELRWLLEWLYRHRAEPTTAALLHIELPAFLTASPETDAHQLARLMLAHQLNAAIVITPEGHPDGIVTSTDYLRLYANVGRQEGQV